MSAHLHNSTLNKKIFIASIVSFIFSIMQGFSQAGTLDSSFGRNGIVTNNFGYASANSIALTSDQKIVIVGNLYSDLGIDSCIVVRYTNNGTFDSTFGINGKVVTYFGSDNSSSSYPVTSAVAIQNDNKIVVGGYDLRSETFTLLRYLNNGNLDSSFGSFGKVTTQVTTWREIALLALTVQKDGKILAGGSIDGFCLIRFQPNGKLDSTFGVNGKIEHEGDFRDIYDLAVLQNGKIIIGITNTPSDYNRNFEIDRLLPDGSPDPTFGINGAVITDLSGSEDWLSSIDISSTNDIVASGTGNESTVVAKYKSNGNLDPTFGKNGILYPALDTTAGFYNRVMIQNDDKVIVLGSVLRRLNSNGSIDSTYGINGKVVNFNGAYNGLLQADGKVVTIGSPYFTLQRFKGDPASVNIQKNLTALEGNSGTTPVTFKIVLNETSTKRVTVNYATVDGTSKAGQDYVATLGTLIFRPGETTKRVTVNVIGDNVAERNERFSLRLSNAKNAVLGTLSTATCTIKNDDASFDITSSNQDNAANNKIKLYPNPVTDILNLEGLSPREKTVISILDVQGTLILKETTSNVKTSVNLKGLTAGAYLVKIESHNKSTTLNFVKIH